MWLCVKKRMCLRNKILKQFIVINKTLQSKSIFETLRNEKTGNFQKIFMFCVFY